ncbi:MAG: MmcQ/YjbR family DNA-binding protein [Candidatus Nomurabacteria bacterium]|jgi:predicted DNA-binding protein (MmcQ/YjbR family)|nr:MmcQ/YjbR family DNA-binding protein [Candidatus Nomurabacteria bacterium]
MQDKTIDSKPLTTEQLLDFVSSLGKFSITIDQNLRIFKTPDDAGRIFLILHSKSAPLRLEVGTDAKLAKLLAERYESVMPSRHISPKEWIEIICAGQLTGVEVLDLVRMSFNRANNVLT